MDKEGVGIEDAGISGLVKGGKAGVNAVDFELVDGGWEEGERLNGWEKLPVGLTMNLVSPDWATKSMATILMAGFHLRRSISYRISTRRRWRRL